MRDYNFEHYRQTFEKYKIVPMDHGIRVNGVVDIHRTTPYVHDLTKNDRLNFNSYKEAVDYALLVIENNPARDTYKKTQAGRMSWKEYQHSKKWKKSPSDNRPEEYHWNNSIHEKSEDHLYFIASGEGVKIGRSKNPKARLKELQTGSPSKLEILCVIKNKGFLEKTIHRCFSDIRLNGEWFTNSVRVARFITLTSDWHLM